MTEKAEDPCVRIRSRCDGRSTRSNRRDIAHTAGRGVSAGALWTLMFPTAAFLFLAAAMVVSLAGFALARDPDSAWPDQSRLTLCTAGWHYGRRTGISRLESKKVL